MPRILSTLTLLALCANAWALRTPNEIKVFDSSSTETVYLDADSGGTTVSQKLNVGGRITAHGAADDLMLDILGKMWVYGNPGEPSSEPLRVVSGGDESPAARIYGLGGGLAAYTGAANTAALNGVTTGTADMIRGSLNSEANPLFRVLHDGQLHTSGTMTARGGLAGTTATLTGALAAATLDTGQGANELYDMDQNVQTTDSPAFAGLTVDSAHVHPGVTVTVASSTSRGKNAADYVCDGTGDETEIQSAIDTVSALGGGTVQLLEGTFNFPSAAQLDMASGVTLIGAGAGATHISDEGSPTIRFSTSSSIIGARVSGLSLSVSGSAGTGMVYIAGSGTIRDIEIDHCLFNVSGTNDFAVRVPVSQSGTYSRFSLHDNTVLMTSASGAYGFSYWSPVTNSRIQNNFLSCTDTDNYNLIGHYGDCSNFVISGNVITGTPGHSPIAISNSSRGVVSNNFVTAPTIASESGIEVEEKDGHSAGNVSSKNVVVTGNVVTGGSGTGTQGIVVRQDSGSSNPEDVLVTGNHIENCTKGIYVTHGTRITVFGNTYDNVTTPYSTSGTPTTGLFYAQTGISVPAGGIDCATTATIAGTLTAATVNISGNQTVSGTQAIGGTETHGTYTIKKTIRKTGSDNASFNVFSITTANESGSNDGGAWTCIIEEQASTAALATSANTAVKHYRHVFSRVMGSSGSGTISSDAQTSDNGVSTDAAVVVVSTEALTLSETSEYVTNVADTIDINPNTSFTGVCVIYDITLSYTGFLTPPVITAL